MCIQRESSCFMQMNLISDFWNVLSVPENEKKIQIAAEEKKFE